MVDKKAFAPINKQYDYEDLRYGFMVDGHGRKDLESLEIKTRKVEKLLIRLKKLDPIYHRVQVLRAAERIVALDDREVIKALRNKFKKPSSWVYRKAKNVKIMIKERCPSCDKPPGPGRHKPSCEVINNKKLERRLNAALPC